MSHTDVIVYISPKIASNNSVWCLEPVAGVPMIKRLFERLLRGLSGPGFEFFAVFHDDVIPRRLNEALRGIDVNLFHSKALHRLSALADFTKAHTPLKTLLIFPENAIFSDCPQTLAMLERHRRTHAEATFSPDSPAGLIPEIYEKTAILRLADLGLPEDVTVDFMTAMNKANELFPDAHEMRFKTQSFSPELSKGQTLSQLPARLLIEDIQSLRAAEAVLSRSDQGHDSTAAVQFKLELLCQSLQPMAISIPKPREGQVPILYSTLFKAFSGAEECFYDLIANLDRDRFYPVAVLPARGVLADKIMKAGVPTEIFPYAFERLTPFSVQYFRHLLEELCIRLVHVNVNTGPALTLAAYQMGIPIVAHVRSFMGKNVDELLHFSSKIITVSRIVREDILRSNLRPEDVVAIYDGQTLEAFRPEKYDKAELRHAAGIPQDSQVITMIARICPQKRQKFLVQSMPKIIERFPKAMALFVGESYPQDSVYYNELLQLIKERHLEKYVRFWGFEKEIAKIHVLSDAMALCTEREPFGHCVLEALAMGLPTVTPREGGGHVEIIQDGENGIFYDAAEPAHLAKALNRLLSDPALMRKISLNGKNTIQDLDIQTHVRKVTKIYEELLPLKHPTQNP